ncbi:unnamed protein product [Fusarium langsethiae]|nr:unnamed protein product [Fusarium langsethiae]
MAHTVSWRTLTAITLTAVTVTAYPFQSYNHVSRSNKQVYCPLPELCISGSCTNTTIGLDPKNCGAYGNSCEAGEVCVAGECQPLNIGNSKCDITCEPGQWCNDGECVAIEIAASSRLCGEKHQDCGAGAVCINGQCQTLDIDPESKSCGPKKVACDAGTWCLGDSCIPFILGTYPQACDDKTPCPLGSSCHHGQCQQTFIATDVYKCGESAKSCTAGQLCVSGSCEYLSFTEEKYQAEACGSSHGPCDPGFFCWESECLPISISIDGSHCGNSSKGCGADEICISGICTKNLFRDADISVAVCTAGSSGSSGHPQGPNGPSRSGSNSSNQGSNGKGESYKNGGKPYGSGSSQEGSYNQGGYYVDGSGRPQYGDDNGNGNGNGYYPGTGSGRPGSGYSPGSRPGSGFGNKGGANNFGPGRPGPGSDGTGSPAPACDPDCSSNEICVAGECLTVSDPLSCGPSSGLSRRQTRECPAGFACIDDRCVPVDSPLNCGGSDCPFNYACIDDACVALGDPTNCGGEVCASDEICLAETCTSNPDLASCIGVVCPSGQMCVAGDCVQARPGFNGNPQGNGGRPGGDIGGDGDGPDAQPTRDSDRPGDGGDPDNQLSLTVTISGSLTVVPNPDATTEGQPEDNDRTSTFGVITEGSTTITFPINPTQTGIVCSVDSDCALDIKLCVVPGVNVCICKDAVCVVDPDLTPGGPTNTRDNGPATTDNFPAPPTGTTTCTTDDDCLADSNACLFNGQNICRCVDGICVQQPITGDPQGRPTSTDGPELTTLDGPDGEPTATITLTGDGPDLTTLDGPDGEPTATVTLTGGEDPDLTTLDGPDGEPTATVTLTGDVPEVTTLDGSDGEPTATVTLTATEPAATETEFPCTVDDDCLAQLGLCTNDGLINLCVCVDAVCVLPDTVTATTTGAGGGPTDIAGTATTDGRIVPTPTTACNTADDCAVNAALCLEGLINICICVDAVCVAAPGGDATTTVVAPTQTADTSCRSADDCVVNADLCQLLGINICLCIDAICVPSNGPDDGDDGSPCTDNGDCTTSGSICLDSGICGPDPNDPDTTTCSTADDCLANVALCLDGLLNLCVCVDAACVAVDPGNGGDGSACTGNDDCTTAGSVCLDSGICGPDPTDPGTTSCNTADDCAVNAGLCLDGLLNLCLCVDAVCVPSPGGGGNDGDTCTDNGDCTSPGSVCLDSGVCGPDPTDPGTTSCNAADDCTVNAGLCLDGLINLCLCVDAVCVAAPGGGGNDGDACSQNSECTTAGSVCLASGVCGPDPTDPGTTSCATADDCTANTGLCLDGLLNICVCVDAVCVVAGGGGGGGNDGDTCNVNGDCTSPESQCIDNVCVGSSSCVTADDCTANAALCLDGLLNICVCLNSLCVTIG